MPRGNGQEPDRDKRTPANHSGATLMKISARKEVTVIIKASDVMLGV